MSCPTASRWFVPDDEYDHATQDYAFVGESIISVQNEFDIYDAIPSTRPWPKTFRQYLSEGRQWFETKGGMLIYSDVDAKNPEHKRMVYDIDAQKPWLEKPEQKTIDAQQALLNACHSGCTHEHDSEKVGTGPWRISDYIVDHVIGLEDSAAKLEALRVLSGQQLHKDPRPTMLLIAILDAMKSDTGPSKSGWAIAYDFEKNKIIVKAFEVQQGQHPLEEAWFEPHAVNVMETPETLAGNLVATIVSNLAEENKSYGKVIACVIGSWLRMHGKAFGFSEEKCTNLRLQVNPTLSDLEDEPFPAPEIVNPRKTNIVQNHFTAMRYLIQRDEDAMRDMAVRAKEEGFETSANNLAKYFEKVVLDLKRASEDPEKPLEF